MEIDLLVGGPDDPPPECDRLRSAVFEFRGKPPYLTDPPGLVIEPDQRTDLMDRVGSSTAARFFLSEQNAVLIVAAEHVTWHWVGV